MTDMNRLRAVSEYVGHADAPPSAPQPPSSGGSGSSGAKPRIVTKARPSVSLPTDRVKFETQVEGLRSYAQLSGRSRGPVTREDLARALEISPGTAGLIPGFLHGSGWLTRLGRGTYAAAPELIEYERIASMDPESEASARAKLHAGALSAWYGEQLRDLPPAGLRRGLFLINLSRAAEANEHKTQLNLLIEWLEWLGLVELSGDLVKPTAAVAEPTGDMEQPDILSEVSAIAGPPVFGGAMPPKSHSVDSQEPASEGRTLLDEAVQEDPAVAPLVSFNLSVNITTDDAARLTPEQLISLLQIVEKLRG